MEKQMDILSALAADPNVDPALRRVFATPRKDYLTVADDKSLQRRFLEVPVQHSAFAGLDEDRRAEIRDEEHADQLIDEQRERNEAGL